MRRFREFQGLLAQAESLRQALNDRKLMERAKGILMQRGALTEEQAFERHLPSRLREAAEEYRAACQSVQLLARSTVLR